MPRAERSQRKLRPRRLILMGSYMKHVAGRAPEAKARLLRGLDGFRVPPWPHGTLGAREWPVSAAGRAIPGTLAETEAALLESNRRGIRG